MTREEAISEIKRRLDIVEFISQYLPLKKSGINYSGRCPFHQEKTPSFMVSAERQTFRCFGCGKGGDLITFVIEKEGLSFGEAIELLANRAGVEMPAPLLSRPGAPLPPSGSAKMRLFELNGTCAKFWNELLVKHPKAKIARDYLNRRGLTAEMISQFQVGFAPPSDTTRRYLAQKGFTPSEQVAAGEPARFADRIVFPIADVTGRIVGFTGRQLPSPIPGVEPQGPKYWNTPETIIFKKSDALYALHLAKDSIRTADAAIIAEGQMDVIGLHAADLKMAVASSGTALTESQTNILSRFAKELVFCYDADEAGLHAAERGFTIALAADMNPSVMTLPTGTDPGDLGFKKPEILRRSFETRQPVIAWLLGIAIEEHGTAQPGAKKAVTKRLLPWLARITDPVERRGWLDVIAERIDTSTNALEEALKAFRQPVRPVTPATTTDATEATARPTDAITLLIGIIGQHPTIAQELNLKQLSVDIAWQPIIAALTAPAADRPELSREDELRLNDAVMVASQQYGSMGLIEMKHEAQRLLTTADQKGRGTRQQTILQAIKEAEAADDQPKVDSLLAELRSVTLNKPD